MDMPRLMSDDHAGIAGCGPLHHWKFLAQRSGCADRNRQRTLKMQGASSRGRGKDHVVQRVPS
jgi:hypothetical protein